MNHAVVVGAWSFVVMLIVAIVNQWLTLNVIRDEVTKQQATLERDFQAASGDFVAIFTKLKDRIWWHHAGLATVFAIGILGGLVATAFDVRIASLTPTPCVMARSDPTPSASAVPTPTPTPTPAPVPGRDGNTAHAAAAGTPLTPAQR